MILFDSHCHPQAEQYDKDREEVIKRALDAGVEMICVGTDLEMSRKAIKLAGEYEGMWAAVGLHPNDNKNEDFDAGEYEELIKMPKVVAMGEMGLDYYRTEGSKKQKFQKERFIKQLELADKLKKPLILHCRDSRTGSIGKAYPQMADILKNGYAQNGGVVHSFTGNLAEAKDFLNLGLYLGFNGIITFPPSRKATGGQASGQYDEIVRYAPLDRVLLETDAPYLTPEPYRGQRNEPLYVTEVAKKIAELKRISVEEVSGQTENNTKELFSIHV